MKEDLADKLEAFAKGADSTLLSRQQEILNSFEKRETAREAALEQKMVQAEKNHLKAQTIREWSSSLLHLLVTVAVAIVLVNALRWGIWEGLRVGALYEWGSQWLWLQIVMIIVFIAGAVFLLIAMYRSVREFFN